MKRTYVDLGACITIAVTNNNCLAYLGAFEYNKAALDKVYGTLTAVDTDEVILVSHGMYSKVVRMDSSVLREVDTENGKVYATMCTDDVNKVFHLLKALKCKRVQVVEYSMFLEQLVKGRTCVVAKDYGVNTIVCATEGITEMFSVSDTTLEDSLTQVMTKYGVDKVEDVIELSNKSPLVKITGVPDTVSHFLLSELRLFEFVNDLDESITLESVISITAEVTGRTELDSVFVPEDRNLNVEIFTDEGDTMHVYEQSEKEDLKDVEPVNRKRNDKKVKRQAKKEPSKNSRPPKNGVTSSLWFKVINRILGFALFVLVIFTVYLVVMEKKTTKEAAAITESTAQLQSSVNDVKEKIEVYTKLSDQLDVVSKLDVVDVLATTNLSDKVDTIRITDESTVIQLVIKGKDKTSALEKAFEGVAVEGITRKKLKEDKYTYTVVVK